MRYKVGDVVLFTKPLMGVVNDGGVIIKEIYKKGDIREIAEGAGKCYCVINRMDDTEKIMVKHQDLENVTVLYGTTEEFELREVNEKLEKMNACLMKQVNDAEDVRTMDKIKASPISSKEQQDLLDRAAGALSMLQVIYDCSVRDHGENDYARMIKSAIDIFSEMRGQWALAVGHPQEISRETIEKIVDRTADVLKDVLKSQIAAGRL